MARLLVKISASLTNKAVPNTSDNQSGDDAQLAGGNPPGGDTEPTDENQSCASSTLVDPMSDRDESDLTDYANYYQDDQAPRSPQRYCFQHASAMARTKQTRRRGRS